MTNSPARKPPPQPEPGVRGRLTARQVAFCSEYVRDFNAMRAARAAGYSPASVHTQAHQVLSKPLVQAEISRLQAAAARRNEITVDRILAEYAKVGFANIRDYITLTPDGAAALNLTDVTEEQFAAIGQLEIEEDPKGRADDARVVRTIKIKMHDKLHALDSIAKKLGMFNIARRVEDGAGNVLATFYEEIRGASVLDRARQGGAVIDGTAQEVEDDDDD